LAVPISIEYRFIAAAGYVINNIFDQDTDLENKPNRVVIKSTESAAYNIYAVLNISGVAIGFYLSNVKTLFAVFILIAALYIYATSLKQMILLEMLLLLLSLVL
jgi:4-hydroxybenzoate polyprenyltransferase